ncbi:MAG: CopG family transcriptional regulator [Nitrospirae bacterium]|nr:CopG family transcriptional regulator [Nitrospirota bacterium]MCL5978503.1 CopG family transcriptional regulator [Nitrospirota bacterium]
MGATLTISENLSKRLERLAKTTKQSKSSLASQAIEDFLTVQEWHIHAIKEGIEAADRGDVVSHKEAVAELKKWGRRAS